MLFYWLNYIEGVGRMGKFLCVGIATKVFVKKDGYSKEKIINQLKKTLDLKIYDEPIEDEKFLLLGMKTEYIEKYAVPFVEEQLKIVLENMVDIEEYERISKNLKELLENSKGKNYEELMQMAEEQQSINFELAEGNLFTNDISYIGDGLTIFADLITYLNDGKIIMESYYDMFRYFRNTIIKSSNSPIKTSAMISIVG